VIYIKYLLWDFDNTLVYRDGLWGSTLCELIEEHCNYKFELETIQPYLKTGFPWHTPHTPHNVFFGSKSWWDFMSEFFADILKELGFEERIASEISRDVRNKYLDKNKWHLYDDTVFCLEEAKKKGYSNIILSNHVPELEELVVNLGIRNQFIKVFSSANVGYEKPNINIYKSVLFELSNAESVTMIGDNYEADVLGALEAGIDAVLVRKSNGGNYSKYFNSLQELAGYL
jgi:putative hydrolase of the HAD superfamily